MAENNQDSAAAQGQQADQNRQSSQTDGQQSSGFDAAKLQSTLEALTHKLDEVDARSRSLQGDKDRGDNQTRKEVDELKRQVAEYEKLKGTGLDPDAAVEEVTFRDDIRAVKDQLSKLTQTQVSANVAGNNTSGAVEADKVIEEEKLDANSPEVVNIIASKDYTPEGRELALRRLAARNKNKQPLSAASATALNSDAVAPGKADKAQLEQQYQKELQAIMQNPSIKGDGRIRALTDLKTKFRGQGLEKY